MSDNSTEPTAAVRDRVEAARQRQRERFAGALLACNADMTAVEARQHCRLDEGGAEAIAIADPSAALRAGLAGSEAIASVHPSAALRAGVAEALQYRARGLG